LTEDRAGNPHACTGSDALVDIWLHSKHVHVASLQGGVDGGVARLP
jgi:hypothetical protein